MRKLLIPLLAALALPTAVNSGVDKKTAEFCLKATDFAGCVETMTRGLDRKRKDDIDDGLTTWTRDNGVIVRMRRDSVKAIKPNGEYGRYIQWNYSQNNSSKTWKVEGDCKEYTVNWEPDDYGWIPVRDIEYLLENNRKARKHGSKWKYEPAREAQSVLNEFCPQMSGLVAKAKK